MLSFSDKLCRMLDEFWRALRYVAWFCFAASAIWIVGYAVVNGTLMGMNGAPLAPALIGLMLYIIFRAPQDFLRIDEPIDPDDGEPKPLRQTVPPAKRR